MIFVVAVIGCGIFTIYASTLFFKQKSREIGIFMALGARKRQLSNMLFRDVCTIGLVGGTGGLLIALPVSRGIWAMFQAMLKDSREMVWQFSAVGFSIGTLFAFFVGICIFTMAVLFLKRTNIIDILNDQRISAPVKNVKGWYGGVGLLLMVLGLLLGYGLYGFVQKVFSYSLPQIVYVLYLLSVAGVYMLLVYWMAHNKRGKRPQKYYKNIISVSMMRFTGRQTVRNMCVIVLLVFGGMFAVNYLPIVIISNQSQAERIPKDFTFTYPETTVQISQPEIREMASGFGVKIEDYQELPSLGMVVDGTEQVWHENGKITYEYEKMNKTAIFYSASDFMALTGEKISVKPQEVLQVVNKKGMGENEKLLITNPASREQKSYKINGEVVYEGSLYHNGWFEYYLLEDEVFASYEKLAAKKNRSRTVVFDVIDWKNSYDFADNLKNEIISRSPNSSAVMAYYDDFVKEKYQKRGEIYFVDEEYPAGEDELELSPENGMLYLSWKYYPDFRILLKEDMLKNMAIFIMLFTYITIICLAAVGIIAYTRGISIAMNYRQVFENLTKLGANNKYVKFCIHSQLKKIFYYPALLGTAMVIFFMLLVFKSNDGVIHVDEIRALIADMVIIGVILIYISIIYYVTFRKFIKTVGISDKI